MRIIGCDFHTRQQTLAMLDTETGELVKMTLLHEGNNVREFYSALPHPVCVGLEATGSMQWFVNLLEELRIECQVGNPAHPRVRLQEAENALPGIARSAIHRELREWEKTYNTVRPHQSLGYLTPEQYLQQWHAHRKD